MIDVIPKMEITRRGKRMKKKYLGLAVTSTLAFLMLATSAFAINNADTLDDLDSTDFALATHAHSTSDVTGLDAELATKADQIDVDAELATKADQTYVDAELATKADQTDVDAELATKADQTYVDAELATKADQTDLDTAVANLEIADANPILPVNASEPYTCGPTDVGAIALTSRFTTCVCNGSYWVHTVDGLTSCEWAEGVVTSAGQVWMDRNLGASQVATSPTDSAAYGDLYQWGRGADGHQLRTSGNTSTISSTDDPGHGDFIANDYYGDWRYPHNANLWQGVNGINNPCPDGFRLPTYTEMNIEFSSWAWSNSAGAFNSPLKLVQSGIRYGYDGHISPDTEDFGFYWTSTKGPNVHGSYLLFFRTDTAYLTEEWRVYGSSVRCLQD